MTPVAGKLPVVRSRRLVALAIVASVVAVLVAAHFHRPPPPVALGTADMKVQNGRIRIASGAPQWDMVKLGPARASTERWTDPVTAHIDVDETVASRIGAPLEGRIVKVFAELGQTLKKGDPLFSVTSPNMAELTAASEKAKVARDAAQASLDRVKAIVQARALPAKEEVTATQQLDQAQVDYRMAQDKLASLQVSSQSGNEFVVRSPRDGVVVEKNVLPGQVVGDGSATLMMVADLSSVWVVAELFDADAGGISVGTKARITVSSLPGAKFDGTVDMVSAVVDPARHTVPVRVRLGNEDRRLKPNTFARMQFLAKPSPGAVEVASSAIVSDGAHQYVYVLGPDGTFGRQEVVSGAAREGRVLVLSGLTPGQTVVEHGAILLDNQIAIAE
jgi:cobalt-zinc-cadmium efflux system membrane fusion protein